MSPLLWEVRAALPEPPPPVRPQLSRGPLSKKGTRTREGAAADQVSRNLPGVRPRGCFLLLWFQEQLLRGKVTAGGASPPAASWLGRGFEGRLSSSAGQGPWPPLRPRALSLGPASSPASGARIGLGACLWFPLLFRFASDF